MPTFPTININGTDAESLFQQYLDAHLALQHAQEALQRAAPHGRDYQTLYDGASAIHRATNEHFERVKKLNEVMKEIESIALNIQEQAVEREAIKAGIIED